MKNTSEKKKLILTMLALMLACGLFYCNLSEVSAASKPAKVKGFNEDTDEEWGHDLEWKSVKGAKGYQIYRNGKAFDITKYTWYYAIYEKKNKTYKYKVRAYKYGKVRKYYNKKTGKWQNTKPPQKYRGKTKSVKAKIYGPFSKTLKVSGYDDRERITMTSYECIGIKSGSEYKSIYCTDFTSIYMVDLTSNQVTLIDKTNLFADNLVLYKENLYYAVHGNGMGNDGEIWKLSLSTGEKTRIVSDMGSYDFGIQDSRIYYQKINKNGNYDTYSTGLAGEDKYNRTKYMEPVFKRANSNASGFSLQRKDIVNTGETLTYIQTPSSKIDISRGVIDIAVPAQPAYGESGFNFTAKELAERFSYYYNVADWAGLFNEAYTLSDGTASYSSGGVWKAPGTFDSDPSARSMIRMYKDGSLCRSNEIPDRVEADLRVMGGTEPWNEATRFALLMTLDPHVGDGEAMYDVRRHQKEDFWYWDIPVAVKIDKEYESFASGKWIVDVAVQSIDAPEPDWAEEDY